MKHLTGKHLSPSQHKKTVQIYIKIVFSLMKTNHNKIVFELVYLTIRSVLLPNLSTMIVPSIAFGT